ncbi:MAG: hypothetical protein ACN6OR_11220 [Stenotrophomonas sp.]|uniref:hypothetical protein n=1 Tax=Stenotrophomonas sp. TaxID=69392 RepID=UPI0028A97F82|nr:hypothetical protein [Stenotrophomonas sp.]
MLSLLARKPWYLLVLPAAVLMAALGVRSGSFLHGDTAEVVAASNGAAAEVTAPLLAAATVVPEQSTAVAAGLPLDLRASFENGSDLYAYAHQLQAAADAGNAEAGWVASRIYDYCGVFAMDPSGYALDSAALQRMDLNAISAMLAARGRVRQGCAGFTAADGLGRARVLQQRRASAKAGNLAAEAALLSMGEPLNETPRYRRELVERVQSSLDPEAFLAISGAMGTAAAGDDAYKGMVAGTQFSQLAWQVAACQLGLACGPESALMVAYCANGGICSRDPRQDFESFVYDAAVPRQGVEKMNEMVSSLRNAQRGVR